MNKALDLLREIRPSIPKEVLELWCKDRDAFLASHPAVEQAGGDERAALQELIRVRDWVKNRRGQPEKLKNTGQTYIMIEKCETLDMLEWAIERARAALAQPSPAQAEAERPEVVARVVHSNPVVLGQCGPLNANDELMTVAQHAASVARWAEMFNRVEQQRDAALARVADMKTMADNYCALLMDANAKLAELEKQEPINLQHMAVAADGELRWMTGRKIDNCELYAMPDFGQAPKLYAAPVAPVQHSVPDVCDGKEQDAFEEWATKQGMNMQCHPMHWLFLDAKTNSARQGWKAALKYARNMIAAAPGKDGV
ncbi:TPA: hypothetical protein L4S42_004220 [Pseudomonas aeruginosa]|nr:hypothetical protein [Pseudomonas aeruginosa]